MAQVLKFTSKVEFFKSGIRPETAAWIKLNDSTGKIQLECFSLAGGLPETNRVEKMQKEIKECINCYKPI